MRSRWNPFFASRPFSQRSVTDRCRFHGDGKRRVHVTENRRRRGQRPASNCRHFCGHRRRLESSQQPGPDGPYSQPALQPTAAVQRLAHRQAGTSLGQRFAPAAGNIRRLRPISVENAVGLTRPRTVDRGWVRSLPKIRWFTARNRLSTLVKLFDC